MALLDKVKQAVRGKSAKLEQGIDKAVGEVDKRTKGKYGDKLTKGAEALKSRARDLDEERRGGPGSPPSEGPGPAGPTSGPGGPSGPGGTPPAV
jgi:hypothetical protein